MIWKSLILSLRLFFDRRVPMGMKLMPVVALLYFLSPIDLIPDWFAALGIIDDIGLMIILLQFFIRGAPEDVLREYLGKMSKDDRVLSMIRNMSADTPGNDQPPRVIEH